MPKSMPDSFLLKTPFSRFCELPQSPAQLCCSFGELSTYLWLRQAVRYKFLLPLSTLPQQQQAPLINASASLILERPITNSSTNYLATSVIISGMSRTFHSPPWRCPSSQTVSSGDHHHAALKCLETRQPAKPNQPAII
jgi:hypothetical protein